MWLFFEENNINKIFYYFSGKIRKKGEKKETLVMNIDQNTWE